MLLSIKLAVLKTKYTNFYPDKIHLEDFQTAVSSTQNNKSQIYWGSINISEQISLSSAKSMLTSAVYVQTSHIDEPHTRISATHQTLVNYCLIAS